MSQLSFCQDIYPKKAVIEKDTVVLLKPFQVKQINSIIIDRNFLKEELKLTQQSIFYRDSLLILKNLEIENYSKITQNYELSLQNAQIIVNEQEELIRDTNKKAIKNCLIVGGISLSIGLLIGLLIK